MRPVCVKCSVEMRCEKNDHGVEFTLDGKGVKFFSGDRYGCPECAQQVVVGFSRGMDSYEPGYDDRVERARAATSPRGHRRDQAAYTRIREARRG